MYSQQELDDAVAAGVITADAANALRMHVQRQRSTAIPDEEQFRLITGFNDIFVSIAAAILLRGLFEHQHLCPLLGGGQRGAERSIARADDDDVPDLLIGHDARFSFNGGRTGG